MTPDDLRRVSKVRLMAASGQMRQKREAALLSLREVAAALQIEPASLSRWENGLGRPRADAALRWAALFNIEA